MEYRELGRCGLQVSVLGFGGGPLGNLYGDVADDDATRAVHAALDLGINFFDTAPYYGSTLSESRLGKALEGRRDQAVLATKCCRNGFRDFDFSAEHATRSLEDSLRRLRTDHLDLFHIHDIEFGDRRQVLEETIPALVRAREAGKTRFIGVTGLPIHYLTGVASQAPVDCVLSYCHGNLLARDLEDVLVPFARERGIGLINASVLHMGVLTDDGPPDWHPAPTQIREVGARMARTCREHGTHLAEVALGYSLGIPGVSSTLVGMKTADEVSANVSALSNPEDTELLDQLHALAHPVLNQLWPEGRPENNP